LTKILAEKDFSIIFFYYIILAIAFFLGCFSKKKILIYR